MPGRLPWKVRTQRDQQMRQQMRIWKKKLKKLQGSSGDIAGQEDNIDYSKSEDFRIEVDLYRQRVLVFYNDESSKRWYVPEELLNHPHPLGEYVTSQKIEYAWIDRFDVGAYYWIRFFEDYLIHSVPFDENGEMIIEEYEKLGNPASHGCIRLRVEEAKWLYETASAGRQSSDLLIPAPDSYDLCKASPEPVWAQ